MTRYPYAYAEWLSEWCDIWWCIATWAEVKRMADKHDALVKQGHRRVSLLGRRLDS